MPLVQFTYYARVHDSRVAVSSQELTVEDQAALDFEIDNERYNLKIAQRYDEVEVSCADLDFACTLK